MRRFARAGVFGSASRLLALVLAVAAIGGAVFVGTAPLENPSNLALYATCPAQPHYLSIPVHAIKWMDAHACKNPTRFGWQIPVAVLLGLVGLGATVVASRRRPEPHPEPGFGSGKVPAGWL